MGDPFAGAIADPWTWTLQEIGRLLLRVRPTSGGDPDQWYVLVPETSQQVQAGGTTVTVTVKIAFSGNEQLGATIEYEGVGAKDVELTVFINVGDSTPSWAYIGLPLTQAEPLPQSLKVKVTTPATSTLSPTHTAVTLRVDATDTEKSLTLHAGRADIPTSPVTAQVNLTVAAIATATQVLASHGISLTGLPLPPTGSGTITVQAPSADTGPAAFSNPAITSMTDVVASIATPGGTAIGTAFWQVTLDSRDNSAVSQPSIATITWTASGVFDVGGLIAIKDPAVRLGLEQRTSLITAATTRMPSSLTVVLATMPDIAFGGASPDPSAAAPVLDYTANARLGKIDLILIDRATPVSPPPAGGTPSPDTITRVVAEDIPRRVVVKVGQFNPNHTKDIFVDLQLRNESGQVDRLGHLGFAGVNSAVMPSMLTPNAGQQVNIEGTVGPRKADISGLKALTLRIEPRPVPNTSQTLTSTHVHYLAATALPAILTLLDDDQASTVVTADVLPTEVTVDSEVPDSPTLQDPTRSWSGSAGWTAAAGIPNLTLQRNASPGAAGQGQDALTLTAQLVGFPRSVTLTASNDGATQKTELLSIAPAAIPSITASTDLVRYSQPGAPFFNATGTLEPLPRAVAVTIGRATTGVDLTYGASDSVSTADVTVRSTALITPQPGQFVPFDHAHLVVTGIPATVNDPQLTAAGPRLTFLLDTAPNQGLVTNVDVPAGLPPIAQAHLRVVDDRPDPTEGDTFPTPAGVRWVNRPRPAPGQDDDIKGAPAGSLLALTVGALRSARYDGRDGQSLNPTYTIARALSPGENAFGVELRLDAPVPVTVDVAVDPADGSSSTWVSGGLSAAQVVSIDGQLQGTAANGHHAAVEIAPADSKVEAVVKRYDRAPDAAPIFGSDPAGIAAAHLARSSQVRLLVPLPSRLEARLDARHGVLDQSPGFSSFEPAMRRGSQLIPGRAAILPAPPNQLTTLAGWVSYQHGFDDEVQLWKEFCNDADERVDYVIRRDTSVTVIPGQPEPQREVHTTGVGPSTLLTNAQVDSVVLARFEKMRGLEASEQTTPAAVGSRPERRFLALWAREMWSLKFRALHLENGQPTADLIEGTVELLGDKTELLLRPEAWATENGHLSLRARVMAHQAQVHARGNWERGFPRVEWPTDTPALTQAPDQHRPDGLTAVDINIQTRGWVELQRNRHWDLLASPLPPNVYQATETWRVHCDSSLDVHGWAVTNRRVPPDPATSNPHPFVTWLSSAVQGAAGPTVKAIQGNVRVPVYDAGQTADQLNNPWFMRPGEAATPHSVALFVDRVTNFEVSSAKICDDRQRAWPVFVADDSANAVAGTTRTSVLLSMASPSGPAELQVVAWETEDWQDSPPLEISDALAVKVPHGVSPQLAVLSTSTVSQLPGKRPTSISEVTVSTSGNTQDASGPAIGPGSLTLNKLDTGANPWAPFLRTIRADLTDAPGFVRIVSEKFIDISRFPDGSIANLDVPGWDNEGAFDNHHASTRRLRAWGSGVLDGVITVTGADFRRSSSGQPPSFDRSPRFDMSLIEATVTATPTGPVDLAHPIFAMLSANTGPAGNPDGTPNDDAAAGLALYAAKNQLTIDGTIRGAAKYGRHYVSSQPMPGITRDDDALTLTLTKFSGKLSVQKREGLGGTITFVVTQVLSGAVVVFIALSWIPGIGVAFAVTLAEAGLIVLLQRLSPIVVDDLVSGGSWYLTPRPSTDLSVLEHYVDGWKHDTWPYEWDLNEAIYALALILLLEYLAEEGLEWLYDKLKGLL